MKFNRKTAVSFKKTLVGLVEGEKSMHLASCKCVRYQGATVIVLRFWTYTIGTDTRSTGHFSQCSVAAPAVVEFRSVCPCGVSGAACLAPISGIWLRCCKGTAGEESLVITSSPLGKRDWKCVAPVRIVGSLEGFVLCFYHPHWVVEEGMSAQLSLQVWVLKS